MNGNAVSYQEVAYRITEEAAVVIFRKKDNSIRVMLCTGSLRVLDNVLKDPGYVQMQLAGRNGRAKAGSNNIAAIDLIIEEVRQFSTDRVICIEWLGKLQSPEELEAAVAATKEVEAQWRDFDSLSDVQQMMFIQSTLERSN